MGIAPEVRLLREHAEHRGIMETIRDALELGHSTASDFVDC